MTTSSSRLFQLCNCGSSHGPSRLSQGLLSQSLDRRRLLVGGAATLALGAAASSGFVPKALAQAKPHRIDVHHHISPPTWLDSVKSLKRDNPPMNNWSVQKSLDDMDANGVATSMTSPTTPQARLLDAPMSARIARE